MAKKTNQHYYTTDDYTALEAITEAQKIAFAPIIFQNALMLRNSGILKCLEDAGNKGCSVEDISQQIDLSPYAIQLLIDVGLSSHIIYQPKEHYVISKIGLFLLNDKMTQINMNFVQDVCYQGMFHLEESLQQQKPAGLKVFSDTPSIYPILHQLPEKTKQSWFAFDHFYSDSAFKQAFNYVKQAKPHHIYDLGGNTGRWANYCLTNDQELQITILDLPEQVDILQELFKNTPVADRIQTIALDILKTNELPQEADIWWMSQFLDCFTPEQIIHILTLIRKNLSKHAKVFILECFWDKQPFEAGALSLNSSSLYFSVMANGNSRFYNSRHFQQYLQHAGFVIEQEIDNIGICHTLLICKPDPSLV